MNIVRLALIGAGVIGQRHIAAINQSSNVSLVAIADPAASAVVVAKQAGVSLFTDLPTLMSTVKPDGVIVATPTELHLQPTLDALSAGAHVLVEKPITPSHAEAKLVMEKSANTNLPVLVGHQRRYYAVVEQARQMVRDGSLGQLVAVTGQWNARKHPSYYAPSWRHQWQAGPILTNLIHEVDYLRYICGDIISISAEIGNTVLGFEKEDTAAILMRFENGALGTFVLSDQTSSPWTWEQATGENAAFPKTGQNVIRFMGTEASLDFPNLVLWRHTGQSPDWQHRLESKSLSTPLEDAYIAQITHFAAVIKGTESPRITAQDATRSLQTTLAVFEAAKTGKRVILSDRHTSGL